jgi:hypothetical protein
MLDLTCMGFFVGDEVPVRADGLIHMPRANLFDIARHVVGHDCFRPLTQPHEQGRWRAG